MKTFRNACHLELLHHPSLGNLTHDRKMSCQNNVINARMPGHQSGEDRKQEGNDGVTLSTLSKLQYIN